MTALLKDPRWFWQRIAVGVVLALVGAVIARRAFNEWGHDLAQLYMSAWLLREGRNVYDMAVQHDGYARHIGSVTTWGHFYPPASAVALLPATLIPYWLARELWFYAGIAVMFYGLWRFMAAYIPSWDRSLRVLVLGLVMCTACVRWGFKVAQPAAMIFGLFGVFLAELKTRRSWTLLLSAGFVGCVKVTFGIPFLLIVAAQRRYKTALALLAIWGSLNVVGIVGMGGFHILADYRANMADFERADQLNYPDPRGFNSLARTDWPYLLNAIDPSFHRNNAIGYALTLATFAWLAWELLRAKKATMNGDLATLALTGPAAAISMLSVYHHHYDMCFLLLPLLGYVGRRELYEQKAAWVYVFAVGLYAGFYPYAKFAELVDGLIGPSSVLFTKPLACVVCIVALVASGKVLHDTLKRSDPNRATADEAGASALGVVSGAHGG
jgi:Glycosyltransferase family 87